VLLSLPAADVAGEGHHLLDAAFTAVSAVCVTGLAVLDTSGDLSVVGQVFLIGLIQVGGLGIMTFTAAVLLGLGQRLTLREEALAAGVLGSSSRADLPGALLRVFLVTLCTELVGAVLLAPMFWAHGDGPLQAAWRALFTAISAFCSAGFALQSDSLIAYDQSPAILLTISAVIIVGSLGPAAVVAFPAWARRRRVSLQVHLVFVASIALTVAPAVLFLALEWGNTLDGLSTADRLTNAWFQSVTLRTAGFNSVDLAAVAPATLVVMLVVMFVGGSPGSTAGGVKTTTAAVLMLAVAAAAQGRSVTTAGRRRIPHRTIYEATAIAVVALFSVAAALFVLLLTQTLSMSEALFEAVSALATVGLSIGATGQLDDVGKVIIILCMFAGRVGPLTVFIFLTERARRPPRDYPEEGVAVG
jgi:trk system potassium uptake protein TrkH